MINNILITLITIIIINVTICVVVNEGSQPLIQNIVVIILIQPLPIYLTITTIIKIIVAIVITTAILTVVGAITIVSTNMIIIVIIVTMKNISVIIILNPPYIIICTRRIHRIILVRASIVGGKTRGWLGYITIVKPRRIRFQIMFTVHIKIVFF